MTLAPGSTFGPYQILSPLGRGGMAAVYKAYEPALDRYVALKILPREFIHDPGFAVRFEREAKVIARLEHPNIIPIHSFGIEPTTNTPWMAMRFVPGGPLSALIRRGRLVPARAVALLRGVAGALDYAHGKGVIHRDVKPQNILLDDAERVYLADFGIAKMVESSPGLTVAGMVTGTPQYMSPEQGMGRKIDSRVDVYALGVVAYEMLTGQVPFSADTPVAVLMKHVTGPIPVPSPEDVPEVFTRALLKALAKKPEERWQSAGAFLQALELGLGDVPTATGIPAFETPTIVSGARDVAPTLLSGAQQARPTAVGHAGPEPTLVVPGAAPAQPVSPARSISGLGLMLGLAALILVLATIGATILLWPTAPQDDDETTDGPLVAESSPLAPETSTLPPPMASAPGESPGAVAPAGSEASVVVSTMPPATALPPATPSAVPPTPTPVAIPAPTAASARPPYRDAGKVTEGKDFFEKTLTFERSGTVPFDAQIGPLRIATVAFASQEKDGRVDVRMLFPVDCPKDAGAWDFVIRVQWLGEDGNTMEDDTDHESCDGAGVTSTLRENGVPAAKAAAIQGVRVRFEATPD